MEKMNWVTPNFVNHKQHVAAPGAVLHQISFLGYSFTLQVFKGFLKAELWEVENIQQLKKRSFIS